MLNAIKSASENGLVSFFFFSLLGTTKIQVGGSDNSQNMTYLLRF